MKKLLLLGGLRYLLPVIEKAHKLGMYVITCDNVPGNIAHRYSDEYCDVSILDLEAVLALAKAKRIDGIMSFAVDPGVVTAAYVAEQMGLPHVGSYDSVRILQHKDLFRAFLRDNGFNVPMSGGYSEYSELLDDIGRFTFPVIVKPVDSAGSKGVCRVEGIEELKGAFAFARASSFSGRVIVEEFIEAEGCSSDTDCFSQDGELRFISFNDQMFEAESANIYAPSSFIWPSGMASSSQDCLASELQRLVRLLSLGSSLYNVETRVGCDGKPYIMEFSPRGGGIACRRC